MISNCWTNEANSPSVTRRFQSDMHQFVELKETRKSLKGFVPMGCPGHVMTVLLDFQPLAGYIWQNSITEFLTWNFAHR